MAHGDAWHFCRLGRMVERADKISRILDFKHYLANGSGPSEELEWSVVLQSANALELYRKRHGRLVRDRIIDFLLLDREFPRSVIFCLMGAEESLHAITGTPMGMFRIPAEQRLGQLRSELAFAGAQEILAEGLHEYVDTLQLKLNLASDAVMDEFFVQQDATVA
jgi:uncharacterized alpha-E superfamily protein